MSSSVGTYVVHMHSGAARSCQDRFAFRMVIQLDFTHLIFLLPQRLHQRPKNSDLKIYRFRKGLREGVQECRGASVTSCEKWVRLSWSARGGYLRKSVDQSTLNPQYPVYGCVFLSIFSSSPVSLFPPIHRKRILVSQTRDGFRG